MCARWIGRAVGGGGVFVWLHAGVCEREKREDSWRTYIDVICLCSVIFFSPRLPEPRANPMDPRDYEDNDSGPSMDHAP